MARRAFRQSRKARMFFCERPRGLPSTTSGHVGTSVGASLLVPVPALFFWSWLSSAARTLTSSCRRINWQKSRASPRRYHERRRPQRCLTTLCYQIAEGIALLGVQFRLHGHAHRPCHLRHRQLPFPNSHQETAPSHLDSHH